jgi:hypothetical protein
MFSLTGQPTSSQAAPSAQGQQQQYLNPYADVKTLSDPYGAKSSYLASVSPLQNADAELKQLQEDIYTRNVKEDIYKDITPLDKLRQGLSSLSKEDEYLPMYKPQVEAPSED